MLWLRELLNILDLPILHCSNMCPSLFSFMLDAFDKRGNVQI
jgi:hypothetical protein